MEKLTWQCMDHLDGCCARESVCWTVAYLDILPTSHDCMLLSDTMDPHVCIGRSCASRRANFSGVQWLLLDRLIEANGKPMNRYVFDMVTHERDTKLQQQPDMTPLARASRGHMTDDIADVAALRGGGSGGDDGDAPRRSGRDASYNLRFGPSNLEGGGSAADLEFSKDLEAARAAATAHQSRGIAHDGGTGAELPSAQDYLDSGGGTPRRAARANPRSLMYRDCAVDEHLPHLATAPSSDTPGQHPDIPIPSRILAAYAAADSISDTSPQSVSAQSPRFGGPAVLQATLPGLQLPGRR